MQYGFVIPSGDIHSIVAMAAEAEACGWDGVFTWDGIYLETANGLVYDPWVVLAAIAMRTQRVRIGAMLTPLARRRPWKVARETVSVDELSHGRLIVPVGLGTLDDGGFTKVGEATDRRIRAQRLDEGLDILTGLWSGRPFSYTGTHYQVQEMTFLPPPVQTPRIPIWVVGAWPRPKSMQRALRYDGLLPAVLNEDGSFAEVTPTTVREMRAYCDEQRHAATPFDIVCEGETPGHDVSAAVDKVRPFAEAGTTWWIEALWSAIGDSERIRTRIRQGPPRIE